MIIDAVPGVTPVSMRSVAATTAELTTLLARLNGADPTLEAAATQAAELAHEHRAGLVAVVEHPVADPGILVAGIVPVRAPLTAADAADLQFSLADPAGPDIREVTTARTAHGYPVVIAERIPITGSPGAQLQAVVLDPGRPRVAVFTLTSPSGRGWLELAATVGRVVTGVRFSDTAAVTGTARVG